MDAAEVMKNLAEGNARYVAGTPSSKDMGKRRLELLEGQHPHTTILSCSDSRIVPEYIFDAGLGDIFTVITAGNVADEVALGSIEYGCNHLHTPLLLVMGHERCGAVKATCDCRGESCEGNIKAIISHVKKAAAKKEWKPPETIMENVACSIANILEKSPTVAQLEKEGKVKIVGAYYSMQTGIVEFLARGAIALFKP